MMRKLLLSGMLLMLLALSPTSAPAQETPALNNTFTYQGYLEQNGAAINEPCDFQFSLWDSATGGQQVGATQTVTGIPVTQGRFSALLDFGDTAFAGAARYLAVAVRCPAGSGDFTPLGGRSTLTATPYALYSRRAPWDGLQNLPAGFADNRDDDSLAELNCANGEIAEWNGSDWVCGSDDVGTNGAAAWLLQGNTGTNPNQNFLGTTDNQPLELRVNNARVLRLEPTSGNPNVIGGHSSNSVAAGAEGATIGGGTDNAAGAGATVGGGESNRATDTYATISGGAANLADATLATVGGGFQNQASGARSTIGGGQGNATSAAAATIGGGFSNDANGLRSTISGGAGNQASADYATISGGGRTNFDDVNTGNRVTDNYGSVGGGGNNQAGNADGTPTNAIYTTVSGGEANQASANYATVGGGATNEATGNQSTVSGGQNNKASGGFATVSGGRDNEATGNHATIPGGLLNRATGDFSFAAGRGAQANGQGSFVWSDSAIGPSGPFASSADNQFLARATGGFGFYTNSAATVGCTLTAGTWNCTSDRSAKANITPVEGREVLEQLAEVPIATWNYTTQDASVRHIGPMAQDFAAAFAVGNDNRTISTVDADGVALAAIQGLHQIVQEQEVQLATQQQQIEQLEARLAALEQQHPTSAVQSGLLPRTWPALLLPLLLLVWIADRQGWLPRRRCA
jgi:hypothetical protein